MTDVTEEAKESYRRYRRYYWGHMIPSSLILVILLVLIIPLVYHIYITFKDRSLFVLVDIFLLLLDLYVFDTCWNEVSDAAHLYATNMMLEYHIIHQGDDKNATCKKEER